MNESFELGKSMDEICDHGSLVFHLDIEGCNFPQQSPKESVKTAAESSFEVQFISS